MMRRGDLDGPRPSYDPLKTGILRTEAQWQAATPGTFPSPLPIGAYNRMHEACNTMLGMHRTI